MRLIDEDKAKEVLKKLLYETAITNKGDFSEMCVSIAEDRIDTWFELIPEIDAVPVVRCKDCKYRIKEGEPFYELVKGLCTLNENFVPDDFYCAEGKKHTYREMLDK